MKNIYYYCLQRVENLFENHVATYATTIYTVLGDENAGDETTGKNL